MAKKKAKNAANQAALDRLYELKEKSANTKYVHTVSRAINSLAACTSAVETRKAAVELKYVGPHIAKVMCPHEAPTARTISRGSSAGSNNSSPSSKKKRAVRPLPTVSAGGADVKVASLSAKQVAHDKAVEEATALKLPSGPWKVILMLDGREHNAERVQAKLQMSGIPCEQRHLPIGDMAWLARCGDTEIMLGTIVERKAVDDLASSLFGTRYLEQRLRLQHCGLPQLLLLVEGDTSTVHNCPGDTLETAMMETRVQLNFQVIQTRHLDDTVRFLKNIHRRVLQRAFPSAFGDDLPTSLPSFASPNRKRRRKNKVSLVDITFDSPPVPPLGTNRFVTYTELKTKVERDREAGTRTVGAIHAAMLKQIPTLSLKKVQAIQQAYPTPKALYGTYVGLPPEDGKSLVQDFCTNTERERTCRVGPKSAAEVYYTYTEVLDEGGDKDGSGNAAAASAGLSQDSSIAAEEGVARMPDKESCSPPAHQGFSSSPVWSSPESDSKPAASVDISSPPRKMAAVFKSSPTSPADEMTLALERRRAQYQDSQKKPAAANKNADDGFVDLTQGYESDAEDNDKNVGFSQSSDVGFSSSQSSFGNSPPQARVASSVAAAAPASSQGSTSADDDEEPLYVRLQRLHQARQVVESRKRRGESSENQPKKKSSAAKQAEVIEIE